MQDLAAKKLRIVAFLCNWCSYGGADTAGVARLKQPTDLRIIRVPCSGRVDPLFVVRALLSGADGILVSGCHPRDCHYSEGNFYARRRLEMLKRFLPFVGIDARRFHYTWVSASEGERWQRTVIDFTRQVHELGPIDEGREKHAPLTGPASALAAKQAEPLLFTNEDLETLKKTVSDALSRVDVVIAYGRGFDPLHAAPSFIERPQGADGLVFSPLCEQNLASYLTRLNNKKVGVVVKGCDSRTVVQLLQEGLIKRENLFVIGIPCNGVVSVKKAAAALRNGKVLSIAFTEGSMVAVTDRGENRIAVNDILQDKCGSCRHPTPLVYDVLVGGPVEATRDAPSAYDDVRVIENMPLSERLAYWERELGRCIRCYACRNACPLCVCRESCIAETRDPHWMTQETTASEKMMFHMIHTLHLAGRCTECGECERACPMGISLMTLKKKINMDMLELFGYVAGTDPAGKPPLLTFKVDEERLEEHKV